MSKLYDQDKDWDYYPSYIYNSDNDEIYRRVKSKVIVPQDIVKKKTPTTPAIKKLLIAAGVIVSIATYLLTTSNKPKDSSNIEKFDFDEYSISDETINVPDLQYQIEVNEQEIETPQEVWDYRMTYYYPGDATLSCNTTASGITTDQFEINENGWYTYDGKLVVATASTRLLDWERYKNSTSRTFNLYDELLLEINGIKYDAIVLDVCGAAMREDIIDLFVKDNGSGLDTKIKVQLKHEEQISHKTL